MDRRYEVPITQDIKAAKNWWTNGHGAIWKALAVGGTTFTSTDACVIKSIRAINTHAATAPTFIWGILDPSAPEIDVALTASSTASATGVSISGTNAPPGVTDTTGLGNYMLLTGSATLTPGTFISSVTSSSAMTLSKATTGASPTGVKAIPWDILGSVSVAAGSGGASAGTTAPVDMVGMYAAGGSFDHSGKQVVLLPAGYKIVAMPITAPAANGGYYTVVAELELYLDPNV